MGTGSSDESAVDGFGGNAVGGDWLDRVARPGPVWFDSGFALVVVASVAVVFASAVVQVSYGSYLVSYVDAWYALFDADIWYDLRVLLSFLLGEELMRIVLFVPESYEFPQLAQSTTVIWNYQLPRVFVAVLIGINYAVAGTIF